MSGLESGATIFVAPDSGPQCLALSICIRSKINRSGPNVRTYRSRRDIVMSFGYQTRHQNPHVRPIQTTTDQRPPNAKTL